MGREKLPADVRNELQVWIDSLIHSIGSGARLSEETGLSQSNISRFQRGQQSPDLTSLLALASIDSERHRRRVRPGYEGYVIRGAAGESWAVAPAVNRALALLLPDHAGGIWRGVVELTEASDNNSAPSASDLEARLEVVERLATDARHALAVLDRALGDLLGFAKQ